VARWVTADTGEGAAADERELKRFIDANSHRVALDAVDAPCVLLEYAGELRAMQENWPKIRFHALREHAGLVFQKQMQAGRRRAGADQLRLGGQQGDPPR